MLVSFAAVASIAVSHSGDVSNSCRSEWNFIHAPDHSRMDTITNTDGTSEEPGNDEMSDGNTVDIVSTPTEMESAKLEPQSVAVEEASEAAKRIRVPDFLFPKLLFDL